MRKSRVESRESRVWESRSRLTRGFAFLFVASASLAASRPEAEQAKIDWLLAEVGNSKAVFIRNGKEYDAWRAVSHLKSKLFLAGKRVQTVREFIVGVASRSSETGKPYEIRLADGTQKTDGGLASGASRHLRKRRGGAEAASTPSPSGRGPG